ncbi:very short patch repair endonuclease [Mucilaginibacter sp. MD40]|uniref:very short patch repair endonuclease n=1 Tax=Mucilaginibacter sp. MD40 TaxID=2029590 RepID=UPI000BAC9E73|nr:DNA mismatch endonuclease Vsr [Mucilaginibacter sp. MD40]PAW92266.1 very short patch repair endonuclease [Mucilaginibacter sp. MD40]
MADNHDKATRSYNMSRIRAKNTRPELLVRKAIFAKGFRYRLHGKDLPGKPDLVLSKYKTVIFIHGCFWHGHHGCRKAVMPKSNTDYWQPKILRNQLRDEEHIEKLKKAGWRIIVLWECALRKKNIDAAIAEVVAQLLENLPHKNNL